MCCGNGYYRIKGLTEPHQPHILSVDVHTGNGNANQNSRVGASHEWALEKGVSFVVAFRLYDYTLYSYIYRYIIYTIYYMLDINGLTEYSIAYTFCRHMNVFVI